MSCLLDSSLTNNDAIELYDMRMIYEDCLGKAIKRVKMNLSFLHVIMSRELVSTRKGLRCE